MDKDRQEGEREKSILAFDSHSTNSLLRTRTGTKTFYLPFQPEILSYAGLGPGLKYNENFHCCLIVTTVGLEEFSNLLHENVVIKFYLSAQHCRTLYRDTCKRIMFLSSNIYFPVTSNFLSLFHLISLHQTINPSEIMA